MSKGYLYIIAAVFLFALSSGILVKLTTLPPLPFFTIGAFWGTLFIFIVLLFTKNAKSIFQYTKQQYIYIGIVGFALGISNVLLYYGLKQGLIANAILSHNIYPILIVLIFGPLILHERSTLKIIALVLVSFLGIFILTIPSFHSQFDNALIFGTLSAIFLAFSSSIEKKLAGTKSNALVPVFYKNLIPFVVFLPFSYSTITHGISLHDWILCAIWGILVLGVSFIFYFKSLQLIPVSHASIIAYGEPVGAVILAFFFFRQPLNGFIFLGGLFIVVSGIILIRTGKGT